MSTMSRLDAVVQDIDQGTHPYTRATVELVVAVLVEDSTVMLEALREIVAVCDQAVALAGTAADPAHPVQYPAPPAPGGRGPSSPQL